MAEAFDYKPPRESGEVRLIKVLPDLDDGHISLTLAHEDLPAKYRCLSYEWREDAATHVILLNGKPFKVRPNLHDFLHRACETWPNEAIWIDAICINQRDVIERGKQVQQMGKIYSGATEVLMWLGSGPAIDLAVSMLSKCHSTHNEANTHGETNDQILGKYMRQDIEAFVDAIKAFAHNPYAERAWVTQEVLLAKQPLLVTTSAVLTLKCLRDLFLHSEHNVRLLRQAFGCELVRLALEWFERQSDPTHPYTSGFPSDQPAKQCTLACDHIYSLLGLVREGSKFPVNYDEDITTLFWRTAEFFTTPPFDFRESSRFLSGLMRLLCVNADDLMVNNVEDFSMIRYEGRLAAGGPEICHRLKSVLERTNQATHECHSSTDDQHEPPRQLAICADVWSQDIHAHLVFEVDTKDTYRLSHLIDKYGQQVLVPRPSGSGQTPGSFRLHYAISDSDPLEVLTTSAFMTLRRVSIENNIRIVRIAVDLPRESVIRTLTDGSKFNPPRYLGLMKPSATEIESELRSIYNESRRMAHSSEN